MKKCEELLLDDAIMVAIENERKLLKMKFWCTAAVITAIVEGIALIMILV